MTGNVPVKVKKKPKLRRDFLPLPVSCLPLLQRGRTGSFFVPLKRIGELKLVPGVAEFGEQGFKDS